MIVTTQRKRNYMFIIHLGQVEMLICVWAPLSLHVLKPKEILQNLAISLLDPGQSWHPHTP